MNTAHTNKQSKKLQSADALNIQEIPGYKQKDNVEKIMLANKEKQT